MSDVKSVLTLLCKYLKLSINVDFKPEYFRLAKLNDPAEYVKEVLWSTLEILSFYAVRELYPEADFCCYAFTWLLATQDPLHLAVRKCLSNSILGSECSYYDITQENSSQRFTPSSINAEINNIIYINGQVNYNLKEIVELTSTKAKLLKKSHTATTNVSGLPHLSVLELALTKRVININKGTYSLEDQEKIKKLRKIGSLLKTHMKWIQKEDVFFNWMASVTQEHIKSSDIDLKELNWHEILQFLSSLKYIIKQKSDAVHCDTAHESINYMSECTSRLVKVKSNNTEIEDWLKETTLWLNQETKDLHKNKEKLSKELKTLLSLIPSCIQI